jgi:ankyrin repeat protein
VLLYSHIFTRFSSSYNKHDTPLMIAAQKGIFKVVQLLLEWNANVDAKDRE